MFYCLLLTKEVKLHGVKKGFAVISSAAVQLYETEFGVTFALPTFLCQDGPSKETIE